MRKNAKAVDTGKTPDPLDEAKPKRGRKPKAGKAEENPDGKEDAGEAGGTPEESPGEPKEAEGPEPVGDTPEKPQEPEREDGPGEDGKKAEEAGKEPEKGFGEPEAEPVETLPAPVASTVIDSPLKRMKQEFSERAQVIKEQMQNIQNAFITIGFQLHWIRENNMFRVLNYKNVYEYAEKEYGISKGIPVRRLYSFGRPCAGIQGRCRQSCLRRQSVPAGLLTADWRGIRGNFP